MPLSLVLWRLRGSQWDSGSSETRMATSSRPFFLYVHLGRLVFDALPWYFPGICPPPPE